MSRKEKIHQIFARVGEILFSVKFGKIKAFRELGLGRGHFWILRLLRHRAEPISVKQLAEELHVTSGAVTQLVEPLVEQGYIARREDPKDRRAVRLELTAKARETFRKLREAHLATIAGMFDTLSDTELDELARLIEKIHIERKAIKEDHV